MYSAGAARTGMRVRARVARSDFMDSVVFGRAVAVVNLVQIVRADSELKEGDEDEVGDGGAC